MLNLKYPSVVRYVVIVTVTFLFSLQFEIASPTVSSTRPSVVQTSPNNGGNTKKVSDSLENSNVRYFLTVLYS